MHLRLGGVVVAHPQEGVAVVLQAAVDLGLPDAVQVQPVHHTAVHTMLHS